jgi:hypothetical protein
MVSKYRKKPVVIDAHQFTDPFDLMRWAERLLHERGVRGQMRFADGSAFIPTPEGEMRADPGDWIICGAKGELYPCKPDIFAATYEAA